MPTSTEPIGELLAEVTGSAHIPYHTTLQSLHRVGRAWPLLFSFARGKCSHLLKIVFGAHIHRTYWGFACGSDGISTHTIPHHTTPHYNLFTVWAARGHSDMPLQGGNARIFFNCCRCPHPHIEYFPAWSIFSRFGQMLHPPPFLGPKGGVRK